MKIRSRSAHAALRRSRRQTAAAEAIEARLLMSFGAVDPTFGHAGTAVFEPASALTDSLSSSVAVEQSGRIIYVEAYTNEVMGLTSTGSLDPSFGTAGVVHVADQAVDRALVEPDGSLILVGSYLTHLSATGVLDTTFGDGLGYVAVSANVGAAVQPNGDVLVASSSQSGVSISRFLENGSIDTTYGSAGTTTLANPSGFVLFGGGGVALKANGDTVLGLVAYPTSDETPYDYTFLIAAVTPTGSLDSSFGSGGFVISGYPSDDDTTSTSLAIAPDGTIYQTGALDEFQGDEDSPVLAYNSQGYLGKVSLSSSTFSSNGGAISVAVQGNGAPVVSGYVNGGGGTSTTESVARYSPASSAFTLDGGNQFEPIGKSSNGSDSGEQYGSVGWSVAIAPNGDTLLAGTDVESAVAEYTLVRLLANPVGSVSGTVFNDGNGDGIQQTGETGLGSVTVYDDLANSGTYSAIDPSTTTSSSGSYILNGLPDGINVIRDVPKPNYRQSYPNGNTGQSVTISSTPVAAADFGMTTRLYVSGTVAVNGVGQAGLLVYADLNGDGKFESNENNKTTLSDGSFAFQSLTAGTYTFRVAAPAGYVQTTPANNAGITETLGGGSIVHNLAFSLSPQSTGTKLTGTVIGTTGSYQNDGNTIAKAFDGNLSNYFDGPSANGNDAGLNLGFAKVITQIAYDPRTGYNSRMVGGLFQASTTASFNNPVTLYTINSSPASQKLTTVAINNPKAYQYVRYLSPDGSYGDVGELVFYGTAPAALTKLSGTSIGSPGSYRSHGTTIANAFDGSFSTYFDGPDASGDWVGLDLGSAKVVTQVKYAPRSGYAGRMVGGEIQASNTADFSSGVVTLYAISSTPTAGVLTTQSLSNSTAYRYYRYIGPANSYCDIAELEFDA